MTLPKTEPSVVVRGLPAGEHTVSLVALPTTCSIEGANPVTVQTATADLASVRFDVNCVATSGAIAVAVSVAGYEKQLWFQARVDSSGTPTQVKGNATTLILGTFPGGPHEVTLSEIPTFCEPAGELAAAVEVKTGGTAPDTALASFNLTCTPPEIGADTTPSIVFERDRYIMVVSDSGSSPPVALSEGESPAWAPDGKSIAFQRLKCQPYGVCDYDLWLMGASGENERPAIEDPNFDDRDAAFGPGADRLSFIRIWLGPDQSYLVTSDLHGGAVGILSIWNPVSTPAWSPDGSRIVYVCVVDWPGHTHLCQADPGRPCDSYFSNRCSLPVVQILNYPTDVEHPAWRPDGKRIAFTIGCTRYCGIDNPDAGTYIGVMDVATRAITRIVPGHDPAWSPDGSRLVFAGNASSPGISVYDFRDGSVRKLTSNPADRSPSWRE
jgi:Tol biopolymer transport system component